MSFVCFITILKKILILTDGNTQIVCVYNTSFVYCRELAPGTVGLTGGWARGDDSKQYSYYSTVSFMLSGLETWSLGRWQHICAHFSKTLVHLRDFS